MDQQLDIRAVFWKGNCMGAVGSHWTFTQQIDILETMDTRPRPQSRAPGRSHDRFGRVARFPTSTPPALGHLFGVGMESGFKKNDPQKKIFQNYLIIARTVFPKHLISSTKLKKSL